MEDITNELFKCKICGILKTRNCIGMFDSGKNKKYIDENNKLWNGKVCPDCHRSKAKDTMFKMREAGKKFVGI